MMKITDLRKALGLLLTAFVAMLLACGGGDTGSDEETVARGANADTSQLVWPISGNVTQNTHPYPGHPGIDIGALVGTPIFAASAGTVVQPYIDPGGYGCNVVINHTGGGSLASGLITIYGHMSQISVVPGMSVDQGQFLGYSGGAKGAPCSGNAQGPHLHFELRRDGQPIRGWDGSVHVSSHVTALDPIDTFIPGLPQGGGGDCEAACANFGCHCVNGQCSGGFCGGTGCTDQEMANCNAYGVNCVDHQCSGGYGPGSGCTAREILDCGNFGANCVDHQCSGGYGSGSGCTARETLNCQAYGCDCVDHACNGGFCAGSGCTAREEIDCQSFGCGCYDHGCHGGFCAP